MHKQGGVTAVTGDGISEPMVGQHDYQTEQPQVLNVTPLPVSSIMRYFLFVTLSGGCSFLLLCSCI